MYPQNAVRIVLDKPIVAPVTLLCQYKTMFTTDDVFEQILETLSLSEEEMPYSQKLRGLNFLRVWLDSNMYPEDKLIKNTKKIIDDILSIGFMSENVEFVDLCYEIRILLNKKRSFSQEGLCKPNKLSYEIEKMLEIDHSKNPSYEDFINHSYRKL
jgi:hypothetical protein